VIRLIQQFLREQNLLSSLSALQAESGVTLNSVDSSVEKFQSDILAGRWEHVLTVTQTLTLPNQLAWDLLAQVVLELCEQGEC
jgi:WD40 repeat-containing protein SMU1